MIFWVVMVATFILDQLTKYYVSHTFEYLESVPVLPNIFHLTYVHNFGAAFSILQNKQGFLILISILVIGAVIYFYQQLPKDWVSRLALGLALGGTFGNLLDRVRFGYVIDFFDFQIWPVFNIADSAIVVGMILFAIKILLMNEEENETGEIEDV